MFDEDRGVGGAGERETERELLAARIEIIGGQVVREVGRRNDGGAFALGEERIARYLTRICRSSRLSAARTRL